MDDMIEAKEERRAKAIQREILRAQSIARAREKGEPARRSIDGVGVLLVVVICALVALAGFLFWVIATGRVQLANVPMVVAAQNDAPDATAQMDNAWQGPLAEAEGQNDPYYIENTVFLGDSNTVRLWMYEEVDVGQVLAQESIGVGSVPYLALQNEGYIGSAVYGQTMVQSLSVMQPERIVMTFGTNDIGGMSVTDFIALYRESIVAVQTVSNCDIIVNSIYPASQWNESPYLTNENVRQFNAALEQMCREDNIPFLNTYEALANADGWCPSEYTIEDGIHLNEVGLAIVKEYFETHPYTH